MDAVLLDFNDSQKLKLNSRKTNKTKKQNGTKRKKKN